MLWVLAIVIQISLSRDQAGVIGFSAAIGNQSWQLGCSCVPAGSVELYSEGTVVAAPQAPQCQEMVSLVIQGNTYQMLLKPVQLTLRKWDCSEMKNIVLV